MRRHAIQTALLLLAVVVSSATLTLGLVLHGTTTEPFAATRSATAGPDVVANVLPGPHRPLSAGRVTRPLRAVAAAPAVSTAVGPFPVTWAMLHAGSRTSGAEVEGRNSPGGPIDRPLLTSGGWARPGGVVVERGFATALGVHVGDRITLGGREFTVSGIAVTTGFPPFPRLCTLGCMLWSPALRAGQPGLVWLTRADLQGLDSTHHALAWFSSLGLRDPATADGFAARHATEGGSSPLWLAPSSAIAARYAEQQRNEQAVLYVGSWLLGLLALATITVLVGGQLLDEVRRIGLLKAIGASPAFVVAGLLLEYLAITLLGAGIGLVVGRLAAPMLVDLGPGLLGSAPSPSLSGVDVLLVVGAAVAVTCAATLVPAVRAVRSSTVAALADLGPQPRRSPLVVRMSAVLPPGLLVGFRVLVRRPRRAVLIVCSVGVAMAGAVVTAFARANLDSAHALAGQVADSNVQQLQSVMQLVTLSLAALTVVNLLFTMSATMSDVERPLAVTRVLGMTPAQAAVGIGVAQIVPVLIGMALGLPAGWALYGALGGHTDGGPPVWPLLRVVLFAAAVGGAMVAVALAVSSRREPAAVLRAGHD